MPATGAFATAQANTQDFRPMMYMQEFLDELEARDMSASYIRTMRNGLHHFNEFLRGEGVVHPEEITRNHIVRFQAHCNNRFTSGEWTKATSLQTLKKARAWINWLANVPHIASNPWINIRLGSVRKQPNPVPDDEMDALWRTHNRGAFNLDPFIFHRREMMLTLLYAWGLRIHELEALTVENMNVGLDMVTARNKGGGTKRLPYTPELKRTFQRWSRLRAIHAKPGVDSLLITTGGEKFSKEQIYKVIVDLGKDAGIKINPHRLRDTCGTNMLDDDVPIERVAAILGHADVKTALQYSRVTDRQVLGSSTNSMDPRLRMFQNTRDLR